MSKSRLATIKPTARRSTAWLYLTVPSQACSRVASADCRFHRDFQSDAPVEVYPHGHGKSRHKRVQARPLGLTSPNGHDIVRVVRYRT
jgi:hypothetical protein